MLLYVPVIITIARLTGVKSSTFSAVFAFLLLDLVFVPPYYRLTVASLAEWLGLIVFFFVALISGQQTAQLRKREQLAVRRQEELALLNSLAFRIASEKGVGDIAEFIVTQVTDVLKARRTALYVEQPEDRSPQCLAQAGASDESEGERELVSWVMRTSKAIGMPSSHSVPYDLRLVSVGAAEAVPGVTARGIFLPLQTSASLEGVLFVEPATHGEPLPSDDARLLAAVANLAATSLERQRLEAEASHAEALQEADRLKSTLVSSVSHELKTPLAAATARITGLIDEEGSCDSARMHEELTAVAEDLGRLNDSIGDLLDLSRLESDAWQPRFEEYDVHDILGTVLSRLTTAQRDRMRFDLPDDVPTIHADFSQLARALSNVVENALEYSPQGSPVSVHSRLVGDCVEIVVDDLGPGVSDAEKTRVFEKFYRGKASASTPSGTGLGLAIASEIVRTHGGSLTIEDAPRVGARFILSIPRGEMETE